MNKVTSIFTVIDYKTGAEVQEEVTGAGEGAIRFLRRKFPRFTKYVLEGFNINGVFKPLSIYTRY